MFRTASASYQSLGGPGPGGRVAVKHDQTHKTIFNIIIVSRLGSVILQVSRMEEGYKTLHLKIKININEMEEYPSRSDIYFHLK